MNIFISQPMTGYTEDEIYTNRTKEINKIKHNDRWDTRDANFITSYINEKSQKEVKDVFSESDIDIVLLAISIRKLADADIIWMSSGWEESRGCKIEHAVAAAYGIPVYYSDDYADGE